MTAPYFNSNTPGGTLQGFGGLLAGLGQLLNPDEMKRRQLIQDLQTNPELRDRILEQVQSDPNAINSYLGRQNRIGNNNSYNQLFSLLSGPTTPTAQAKIDVARAQSAKAASDVVAANNQLAINKNNAGVIAKGQREDEMARESGLTAGGINWVKGPDGKYQIEEAPSEFRNPADRQLYQELQTGKVLTPAERAAQQAEAIRSKAASGEQVGRTQLLQQQLADREKNAALAEGAMQRLGKNTNLYQAIKAGKVSSEEAAALVNYDKTSKLITTQQSDFWDQQRNQIEQARLADEKRRTDIMDRQRKDTLNANLAAKIKERFFMAGHPVSDEQVQAIMDDPETIMKSNDPNTQYVRDQVNAMRKEDKKTNLNQAHNLMSKALLDVNERLNKNHTEATEADINELNMAAENAYAGTMFKPPTFSLGKSSETTGSLWWKHAKAVPVMSASDPEDKSYYNKIGIGDATVEKPTKTPSNNQPLADDNQERAAKMIANGQATVDNLNGLDAATKKAITDRVNQLKSSSVQLEGTTKQKPEDQAANDIKNKRVPYRPDNTDSAYSKAYYDAIAKAQVKK